MEPFSEKERLNFPDATDGKYHIYRSNCFSIIRTSYITYEECICNDFHFLIPICNTPSILMDKKTHKLESDSIFPCNPRQPHQIINADRGSFDACVLYVDKNLLEAVSESMFGSDQIEFRNSCIFLRSDMKNIINTFIMESDSLQPGSELLLNTLSIHAAVYLLREGSHNFSQETPKNKIPPDKKSVQKAIEYLAENFNKNITLNDLACEMNYSPYHFLRIFKLNTGMTPFEYLMNIKIEKARNMLDHTDYSITKISDLCGFSSISYFTQVFKKKEGVSPSQYKKKF